MATKQYQVTGAYVTTKTMTTQGMRVIGLHRGAPVPADIDPEHLKHLIAHELVGEVGQPQPDPMPPAQRAVLDANEAALEGRDAGTSDAVAAHEQRVRDRNAAEARAKADAEAKAAADKQATEAAAARSAEAAKAKGGQGTTGTAPGKK
jgi:hypothetical protein